MYTTSRCADDGELVALLGPSGSGKSTILRIVAGLTSAELGRVSVDGLDVTALPPQSRDLGFVFQNYALFEHLTVADNAEFALRVRKVERGSGSCAATSCSNWWAWAAVPASTPRNYWVASASERHPRGHWRIDPACCCWMSRSGHWTHASAKSYAKAARVAEADQHDRYLRHP